MRRYKITVERKKSSNLNEFIFGMGMMFAPLITKKNKDNVKFKLDINKQTDFKSISDDFKFIGKDFNSVIKNKLKIN